LTGGTLGQDNGWNLVGNPYPAPIQWTGGTADGKWSAMTDVSTTVSIRENFGSQYRWRVWNGTTGNLDNGIIAPGQAFWVQATSATPALVITENAKFTSDGAFYREGKTSDAIEITMTNGTLVDETYILAKSTGLNTFSKHEDALKQANTYFNFSSKSEDGKSLVINTISSNACQQTVPLNIENASKGNYSLKFGDINPDVAKVYLKDAFTGTETEITGGKVYSFTITDNSLSKGTRFSLVLVKPAIEAIQPQAITAASVCNSTPVVTIENTIADVEYQAFLGTTELSEKVLSTGGTLQLPLGKESLGTGTFQVDIQAGYSYANCSAAKVAEAINVTVDELVQPVITPVANKLSTTYKTNYTYQWYLDGAALEGQTQFEIYPSSYGVYTVSVTNGSCARFADGVNVSPTGNETSSQNALFASPNPFTDKLVVNLKGSKATSIKVTNVVGETVVERAIAASDESITLDLAGLPQGAYVVIIGATKLKVIKKA
jgi:hypothetical protein